MRRTVVLSALLVAAFAFPATASALTVQKASLSAGQLRVEGSGAAPNNRVSVSGDSGLLSAPRADQKGAFKIQVAGVSNPSCKILVSDGQTPSATVTLSGCTPTTTPPPSTTPSGSCVIDPTAPLTVNAGTFSSYAWSTTGCAGPVLFELVAGGFPTGMGPIGFNTQTGAIITGTPSVQGTFTFTIRATDQNGQTDAETSTITVVAPRPVTILNDPTLPSAVAGQSYDRILNPDGGVPGYTWRLVSGALPAGFGISSAGHVFATFGNQARRGTYSFTIGATDSRGSTGTKTFSLTVG